MFLVSACLAGIDCTFTGKNNRSLEVQQLVMSKQAVPVCPEQLGGLSTPRPAAEIQGGVGGQVLSREAQVVTRKGEDVTQAFFKGAQETLKLARLYGVEAAILKEGSPSCGSHLICDGTFTGTKIPGLGVTAALLEEEGVRVFSENEASFFQKEMASPGRGRIYIGVIGAACASDDILALAYGVGQELAKKQAILLCGGRGGVMEAVSQGIQEKGGLAVGILPGDVKGEGNPYLGISLATGLGEARNAVIARSADGLIAIGGAYGTLSELGLALKMGKRVVGLKTWQLVDSTGVGAHFLTASSPQEAVSLLFQRLDKPL